MHQLPRSLDDLNALIANRIEESLHLDYKASATFDKSDEAVRKDLAKDVSSFANSDGGTIVYGVLEHDRLPTKLDGGVSHSLWPSERVENVILANVFPRLSDLEIVQVRTSDERSYYVMGVGKSFRGPHQSAAEKRYFKRFNFKAEPMEDYEIRDVLNRRDLLTPLVVVDVELRGALVDLVIKKCW